MIWIARIIFGPILVASMVATAYAGSQWFNAILAHHQSVNEYWAIDDRSSPEGRTAFNKTCDKFSETGQWFPRFMLSLLGLFAVATVCRSLW